MKSVIKYSIIALFTLVNIKCIPFSWTLRFYFFFLKHLLLSKLSFTASKYKNRPAKSLFEPTVYSTRVNLFECDPNMHKSNSTYFSDLDLARTDLVLTLFIRFFNHYKSTTGVYPYVPLGSVMTVFKQELKPLQAYKIRSRILGWDNKWLFVLSRFETGSGSSSAVPSDKVDNSKLAAVSLSKYVFKLGRKTIPPEEVIKWSGINVDEKALERGRMDFELAKGFFDAEATADCPM